MDDPRDNAELGVAWSALNVVPYRLNVRDYVQGGAMVLAIGLVAYGWPLRESGWAAEAILFCALGFLCYVGYRAHSLCLKLRRLEDVFETLRCAQSDGLPLDDVFEWIVRLHLNAWRQTFLAAPSHPTTRAILKAIVSRNPTVDIRDEDDQDGELVTVRPHVLYRNARKRMLRRFRGAGGEYVALFRVRGNMG